MCSFDVDKLKMTRQFSAAIFFIVKVIWIWTNDNETREKYKRENPKITFDTIGKVKCD